MLPLISACIPTYNSAQYIRHAIDSILQQSYDKFELIVVDNASTDNTEEIVRSYHDSRIFYFKNESNIGYPGNVNRAIGHAKGDFITIVCADDYLVDNDVLKRWASEIVKHPECVAIHSAYTHPEFAGSGATMSANSSLAYSILNVGLNSSEEVFSRFFSGSGFFGWGWCFSGEVVSKHNIRFKERLTMAPDTLFWLELASKGPVFETPNTVPAYAFVIHGNSLGTQLFKDFWNNVVLELTRFEDELSPIVSSSFSPSFFERYRQEKGRYTANESICILKNNYIRGKIGWAASFYWAMKLFTLFFPKVLNKRFLANIALVLLPRSVSIYLLSKRGRLVLSES